MLMNKVLLVAAENDALIKAKVGGMGDVIRDLPKALSDCGISADVAMPEYGFLKDYYCADKVTDIEVSFGGKMEKISIYRIPRPESKAQVCTAKGSSEQHSWVYLFAHPMFNQADGSIYTQGSADRPFADDADKFALFCLAVASALVQGKLGHYDVMHLHDWHTAMIAMLRKCVDDFASLKQLKCIYTIHNLALQGIRPLTGDKSSLCHWYPQWFFATQLDNLPNGIVDPRYPNCANPMRMGIVFSDKVHVVSPTYAKEILLASHPEKGFYGGEGLEQDLQLKAANQQLVGIINGCDYTIDDNHAPNTADSARSKTQQVSKSQSANLTFERLDLLSTAQEALIQWQKYKSVVSSTDFIANIRVEQHIRRYTNIDSSYPGLLVTSVGRLTTQKVMLFLTKIANGKTVLDQLLINLKQQQPDALFMLLGSGDEQLSNQLKTICAQYANSIFLNGYDEQLSQLLYQQGELFLMPSSFEPCGISQMLAMKHGQPCLVHGVGGLKDTVKHDENGWVFNGDGIEMQANNFISQFNQCLQSYGTLPWQQIKQQASMARFDWQTVAQAYKEHLYN
jgi:starch synthase